MAEEIPFENDRISNFEGLVTLDRVIPHTVVHHSSTSTYMPNFIEIEESFCGRQTYVSYVYARTYARTDRRTSETGFIGSTLSVCLSMSVEKSFMSRVNKHRDSVSEEL